MLRSIIYTDEAANGKMLMWRQLKLPVNKPAVI